MWTGDVLSNTTGTITNFNGATWNGNATNNGGTLANEERGGAVTNAGTFDKPATARCLGT